jgi:hypothetical protein
MRDTPVVADDVHMLGALPPTLALAVRGPGRNGRAHGGYAQQHNQQ